MATQEDDQCDVYQKDLSFQSALNYSWREGQNMAEKPVKIGTRVEIIGKGWLGKVAFVGTTTFATGKWIGVALDEPKGKNNGTVQGKKYFTCPDNHGILIRQSQVKILDDGDRTPSPVTTPAPASSIPKPFSAKGKADSALASKQSRAALYAKSLTERNLEKHANSGGRKSSIPSLMRRAGDIPSSPRRSSSPSGIQAPKSIQRPSTKQASKIGKPPSTSSSASSNAPSPTPTSAAQAPAPPELAASMGSQGDGASSEEAEFLKMEVKDLQEKLETLKMKRAEDRAKLKEGEKMRIQLQQLQEFKSKMIEAKVDLERQLQDAKTEAREAVEEKERHSDEMAGVAETIEMATLDKEMAEEKADTLQQEVDTLKEQVEELTLDLELLRSEIEEGGTEGASASYQLKQLEQQNNRLKEALVKLRDLSNTEKQEHQRAQKDKEKLSQELKDIKAQKDSTNKALKDAENTVIELKEQVDAALGAEEMVESLTEKNLEMEEKFQELEATMADLEAMNDMNEELQENARETEMELREELDMSKSQVSQYQIKINQFQENTHDHQETIAKFRQLTASLQEKNRELMNQTQSSETDVSPSEVPAYDFTTKFAEAKAQSKTIEVELRKLEVNQANEHIRLLTSFMPDSFLRRGGDHDCVHVLMLVSRMLAKSKLLINHVKDKAEIPETVDREQVLRHNFGEQLSFFNSLTFMMHKLRAILNKYNTALNTCSVELFCKIGTLFPEIAPHERCVDHMLDLLRKDQLDENVSMESLERAIEYLEHLYSVHLLQEEINTTTLMANHVSLMSSGSDCVALEVKKLRVLMQANQETADFSILMRDMESTNTDLKQFARMIRRRLPSQALESTMDGPSPGPTSISYGVDVQNSLYESADHMRMVVTALKDLGHHAMKHASSLADEAVKNKDKSDEEKAKDTEGIPVKKLEQLADRSSELAFGKADKGPYQSFRERLVKAMVILNKISTAMQEGEYDANMPQDKVQVPVERRALKVKSEICDAEGLGHKLESKESEMKEMKRQLKQKQDEVSTSQVRLGLVEKKLENASRDAEDKVRKVDQKLAAAQEQSKKKEKEFEATLDHMQVDIDSLEQEKSELKQRLTNLSKKTLLDSITRTSPQSGIAAAMSGGTGQGTGSPTSPSAGPSIGGQVVIKDSPMLLQQLDTLRYALRHVKHENSRLRAQKMKTIMDELPPLNVPKKPVGIVSPTGFVKLETEATPEKDEDTSKLPNKDVAYLTRNTRKIIQDLHNLAACPRVVDISHRKPGTVPALEKATPKHQMVDRSCRIQDISKNLTQLKIEMQKLLSSQKPGAHVTSAFNQFTSTEYSKVQEEQGQATSLGRVYIPLPSGQQSASYSLNLQPHQLKQLYARVIAT
ncbi:dynactin subunit 1 isoform X2 [Strongylocentrotus purpuratus]|uniref:Dynactin subunit 1 n=1 Tax=Strongylocentrotus purpuratus TaxID=7668 RepID=A0A7M7NTS4_STRPU|nr:dynactin subunit 1 isoform X2 [Strongylocentrotus purpuratus]